MRTSIFLVCLLLTGFLSIAQDNYWQQHVNYQISVELDDENHQLKGNLNLIYQNNSPDTLKQLYFHLWPNAYKDKETALAQQFQNNGTTKFLFSEEEEKGYINEINFSSNGQPLQWSLTDQHKDIALVTLNAPLLPGKSVNIATPFLVKIPGDFSRLGHVGQSY